jgi:hypothetical protein
MHTGITRTNTGPHLLSQTVCIGRWHETLTPNPNPNTGHAFSPDGLHWTLAPEPAWNLTVAHTDGTNTTFWHRERPQVYVDPKTGAPTALFNAVSLANANQPFPWQKDCPPHPSHIQVCFLLTRHDIRTCCCCRRTLLILSDLNANPRQINRLSTAPPPTHTHTHNQTLC